NRAAAAHSKPFHSPHVVSPRSEAVPRKRDAAHLGAGPSRSNRARQQLPSQSTAACTPQSIAQLLMSTVLWSTPEALHDVLARPIPRTVWEDGLSTLFEAFFDTADDHKVSNALW